MIFLLLEIAWLKWLLESLFHTPEVMAAIGLVAVVYIGKELFG